MCSSDHIEDNVFGEDQVEGQAQVWNLTLGFAASMTLRAVCLLGIPDILARAGPGATLSLQEIASQLPSQAPNTDYLFRILRFLGTQGVFAVTSLVTSSGSREIRYGLTPTSKCLVTENKELYTAPQTIFQTDKVLQAAWQHLAECVLEGGIGFTQAHGVDVWSFTKQNPDFSDLLNEAMACSSETVIKGVLEHYDGFKHLHSLVDVGGGIGRLLSKIIEKYPSITGINYDLHHVVASAPSYPGMKHVGGNMFESIPHGDAIIMKWVMHDWDDASCINILENCRKALPDSGKVIIVDAILSTTNNNTLWSTMTLVFDLLMLTYTGKGKERTEEEWKALLTASGFPHHNIISLPTMQCGVIEGFMSDDKQSHL